MNELLIILSHLNATVDEQNKVLAFAKVESNYKANAVGDKGKAHGWFQFHEARWKELTNHPYSCISTPRGKEVQVRVMLEVIRRHPDLIRCANYHNRGSPSNIKYKYTRKILKEYQYHKEHPRERVHI